MKKQYPEILEHIIDKMFEISNHSITYKSLLGRTDPWYTQYEMTKEQEQQWLEYGISYIRSEMKLPKYIAKDKMAYIHIMYGLKVKE